MFQGQEQDTCWRYVATTIICYAYYCFLSVFKCMTFRTTFSDFSGNVFIIVCLLLKAFAWKLATGNQLLSLYLLYKYFSIEID